MSTKWEPPRPSTYTPLLRRFTNERGRELADSKRLFGKVIARFNASAWGDRSALTLLISDLATKVDELGGVPDSLKDSFSKFSTTLLADEPFLFPIEEVNWEELLLDEQVELREQLRNQEFFLNNEKRCTKTLIETIALFMTGIASHITVSESENPLFELPLLFILEDTNEVIEAIFATIADEKFIRLGLFEGIGRQLYLNLVHASNLVPDIEQRKPFIYPSDKKLAPQEAIDVYLRYTPFYDLLSSPAMFSIPAESFFQHCHVIGGTGAGKTQWLSQLILHHIKDPQTPSLVVVDSQGDLIPRLNTLKEIQDRLVYIDPTDPPHINLFDEGAMEAFDYLFGMFGADLTAKQSIFFRFVGRLMMSIPGAGLMDMLKTMQDVTLQQQYIDQLPEVHRNFFKKDFQSKTFSQTKEQVRYRLNAILENPTLQKLFEPGETLDIDHALDNGKIILVDTSKEYLKGASPYFGRIFISLVLKAIYNRASQKYRHPVHLIIDEAQEYFDDNIDEMLTQVRKYKMGCVFAHQYLGQCTQQLRNSLAANTSIKMVSGVSASDATVLAKELRTTADFILAQPQLTFATYVRNVTSKAISLPVTPGLLDKELHVIRKKPPKTEVKATPEVTTKDVNNIDTSASDKW